MQNTGVRGARRAQVPAQQQRAQARLTNLNHQLRGTRFTPAPQPRAYTAVPWNSLTLEFEQAVEDDQTDELELTVSTLSTKIQTITGSIPKFKVVKYEAWVTATGLSYPSLKAQFFDVVEQVQGTEEPRSQQSDRGTLNMPAKVGYIPPMTDQKRVFQAESVRFANFATGGAQTGMTFLVRVHVLWKYNAASF